MLDEFRVFDKDIDSNEKIFLIVSNINIELKKLRNITTSEKILHIVFDEDIKFVNPLFFSLTIQILEQYKDDNIVLVFDVLNFIQNEKYSGKDPRQHYISRILLAIMSAPHFLSYLYKNEDQVDSFREQLKTHITNKLSNSIYVDNQKNEIKKSIVLLFSRKHKDTIYINSEEDRTYRLLPIIKLTNFPDYIYANELSGNEFDARKHVYQSITISSDSNYNSKILKENFEKYFIDIVKPIEHQDAINQPLKDIFFEMVDNIKRHAKFEDSKYADSYFNFYYDVPKNTFKFHIIDNLNTGFINTYIKTMENDRDQLIAQGLDTENFYDNAIKNLENPGNDESFLKLLFSEYGWFHASKIPRIVLHFGIPLLVEIVKNIAGSAYIRLHRVYHERNRFYEIIINESDILVNEIINKEEQIEGTYITIDIPNRPYASPPAVQRNLGKKDFTSIEKKKEVILKAAKSFVNGAKQRKQYAIHNYEAYTGDSISDFIRYIYIEAHQKKLSDILVIGIDLQENIEYFKTLTYLLYHKDYTINDEFLPINILFWNITSFDIFFIGGRNRYEFCKSNQLLYKQYGQKNYFIIDGFCSSEDSRPAQSIFFIEGTKEELSVLPFELLIEDIINQNDDNIWKKISYQRTIVNHLEKNKLDVHFDTQRGYHIDGFYKFDTIFQNSSFFERLAYILTVKIIGDAKLQNKKLVFIGFGKYLNLFIALLIDMLMDKSVDVHQRYHILHNDEGNIDTFLEDLYRHQSHDLHLIMISSVIFNAKNSDEFVQKHIKNKPWDNYSWYSLIRILLEDIPLSIVSKDIESLIELNISKNNYYNAQQGCPVCIDPDKEKPLLKIDRQDEYKLEKTYFGSYDKKQFTSTANTDNVKFYNSISFGHIARGESNHYLYYTKTVNFLEDNKENKLGVNIELFLDDVKKKYPIENLSNAVILIPMHCTVNRFASMVHKIIFENKANIFQFDQKKGIKNFHELKKQLKDDMEYTFYFVDDEISSGTTLEYFYSLVRYCGKNFFEKIFILMDRSDSIDERLILNFVKNQDSKHIHVFSKMEIRPIKTATEPCFLCDTRQRYKQRLKNTFIDMNRFAFANRIVKLNIQDSKQYDFEKTKEFNVYDFRLYLKMYALDYIYSQFDNICPKDIKSRQEILKHYSNVERKFIMKVQKKIQQLPFKEKIQYSDILEKIGEYEGSIAFLKALSFPKLVYYYNIRYMITIVLISSISKYVRQDPETAIEFIFEPIRINEFIGKQVQLHCLIRIDRKYHGLLYKIMLRKSKYAKFLRHFSVKINMNHLSFLHKTAAYLDIHYVIDYENVKYYYKVSEIIKNHDMDKANYQKPALDQSLVEYYQLASKMVAEYSEDRAKYLEQNIENVFKKETNGYDNLLGALLIENHNDKKINDFSKKVKSIFQAHDNISQIITQIEALLKYCMDDDSLKIYSIYVNQYADLQYDSYAEYLDKMCLVDILHNYKNPQKTKDSIEERLTKGYLSRRKKEFFNPNDDYHINRINNTWSNLSTSKYAIQDSISTDATLVKLVDIDTDKLDTNSYDKIEKNFAKYNKSLWYRPIGCIVATYTNPKEKRDYRNSLSKCLLAIQDEIVQYLKEKFLTGMIQEAIQTKEYENIFSTFNHEVAPLFELNRVIEQIEHEVDTRQKNDLLSKLKNYVTFAESITKIGRIKKYKDIKKMENAPTIQRFFNTYSATIQDFFSLYSSYIKKQNLNDYQLIPEDVNDFKIPLSEGYLKILFFELLFNCYKYSPDNNKETKVYLLNEQLYIKNVLDKGKEKNGNEIALKNLRYMLNEVDWELKVEKNDTEFIVKLYSKEKE